MAFSLSTISRSWSTGSLTVLPVIAIRQGIATSLSFTPHFSAKYLRRKRMLCLSHADRLNVAAMSSRKSE